MQTVKANKELRLSDVVTREIPSWTSVKANELQLADIVIPVGQELNGYSTVTVREIKDAWITLFRPYTHSGDFEYSSGVLLYVGIEEYKIHRECSTEFFLISRKNLN